MLDATQYDLTVCIPVYNSDIRALVETLKTQIIQQALPVHIFALDDGSEESFLRVNRTIVQDQYFKYEELPVNIGRSMIRNKLGFNSSGTHLLFLDSDLHIEKSDYLQNIIHTIHAHPDAIVVGGVNYPPAMPDAQHRLHWYYGHQVMGRKRSPEVTLKEFISFNFVIPKKVFATIHFDESIVGYGHEDTLMGYQLTQNGIPVSVIDNPVLHHEIDLSTDYLNKIKRSIYNLKIMSMHSGQIAAVNTVKLVKAANRLRATGLASLVGFILKQFEKPMTSNLLGPKPSLFVLKLYKLSLYLNTSDADRI